MNRILRIPLLILLMVGIIGSFGLGVVGVHAATDCQQLLRFYKEKVAPHKVSAATAARWAAWNKAHPNYHPRPKMTPKETLAKLEFACQIPTEDQAIDSLIPPVLPAGPIFPLVPIDLFMAPNQPDVIARNDTPRTPFPDTPTGAPTGDEGPPPVYYPSIPTLLGGGYTPPTATPPVDTPPVDTPPIGTPPIGTPPIVPPIAATPEPGALLLMTTALGFFLCVTFWKRMRASTNGLRDRS
jgi:hypothetical protein